MFDSLKHSVTAYLTKEHTVGHLLALLWTNYLMERQPNSPVTYQPIKYICNKLISVDKRTGLVYHCSSIKSLMNMKLKREVKTDSKALQFPPSCHVLCGFPNE